MTCLAYRDGVLAADTQVNSGNTRWASIEKIGRLPDGRLWGFTGACSYQSTAVEWAAAGCHGDPPKMGDSTLVLVSPDGLVAEWNGEAGPLTVKAPFLAWGSGTDFALGAMFAGADAETAVRSACAYDRSCGGEISVLKIGKEG